MRVTVAVVAGIIAPAAVVAAWTVMASAILCKMMGQMAAFVFPFDQWWQGLSWFHLNWQIVWLGLLNVIASGILAALPVLAIGMLWVRLWWRRPRLSRLRFFARRRAIERGDSDNHGHADYMTIPMMRALFPSTPDARLAAWWWVRQTAST
jgi:type IV secretion system protein VirD4